MNRIQRVGLAASSAAACMALAGCGALHDAPISNAKANNNPAISQVNSHDAVTRQAEAQSKQATQNKADKAAAAKAKKNREKADKVAQAKKDTAEAKSDLTPVSSSSDIPAWVTVINWAQTKLGTPYLWGGTGTAAQGGRFDCSGLTQAAFRKAGIELPRVAQDQYNASNVHPKWKDLRPGDLVFFGSRWNLHHVGIYLGSGMMIHSPNSQSKIRFNKVHYMDDYYGATRVG